MNKQHGSIYYIHTFLCIIFLNCIFIFNFSLLHDSHGSHSGSHDSLACTLGRPQFSSSCIPLSTLLIFNPTFHKNSQLGGQIIQFSFATYFNIIPKVTLPLCPLFNQLCDDQLAESFADHGQILACTCHFERQKENISYVMVSQTKKEDQSRVKKYIDAETRKNLHSHWA